MTTSRIRSIGGMLVLAALLPLECRHTTSENTGVTPDSSASSSGALDAREVADYDMDAAPNAPASNAGAPVRPEWEIAAERNRERMQRERRTLAEANWQMTLRTDTPEIVPCQPLYITIKATNRSDHPRKLRDLFQDFEYWIFVGRSGEEPRVVKKLSTEHDVETTNLFDVYLETLVAGRGSVFFDRILTTERVEGEKYNNPIPKRIFSEPGKYKVYAAVVDPSKPFAVLRSEPLAVMVRKPTQAEAPYVEFFREGRQIPPHYGFSKVKEEAFDKLRGSRQPARIVAFSREVDEETIDALREILAKHPDPPVADDMRHYLTVVLMRSARQYDENGRNTGVDKEVLAAAAQQYLAIAPERRQLRRRSIKRWHGLTSHQYSLDEARPVFEILASWKTWSPFYEDEVESQAALEKIMDEIEAPLADQARQRASSPRPKPNLPTD